MSEDKMPKNNSCTIIIAEDDADLNGLIADTLCPLGCQLETMTSGRDVISRLDTLGEALLLLDYKLPDMTAGELVNEVQRKKKVPFVIMTGYADVKIAVELMKLGARDYLIKDTRFLDLLPVVVKRVLDELSMESALSQTESALHKSEEKYRALYDNALMGMISVRVSDKKITAINELGCKILGYANKDEVIEKIMMTDVLVSDNNEYLFKEMQQNPVIYNREIQLKRKDASSMWCMLSARLYQDEDKIEGAFTDITGRKEAEERIHNLTYYDQLTKLPNKEFFKTQIQNEIMKAEKRGKGNIFAVMCIGIDKFRHTNNIYGPEIGNSLLQQLGMMLQKSVFKNDTVCRFEGDKFMILFSDIASRDDAGNLVRKIHGIFSNTFEIDRMKFVLSATAGICLYPEDGVCADILMKNSQAAMDMAKARGIHTHFFDAILNAEVINSFQIIKGLKEAMHGEEFIAYYQPMVGYDGEITGIESLIRWHSSERGLVMPGSFIPIAENNGMIIEIGKIILKKSCIQNKKWQDMGCKPVRVAVNLSPYQFSQANLVKDIEQILNITGLSPLWLELEITESGIIENEKESITKINEMHGLGISVSIDDFGTGYSSLSKLKDYPIDILKIDKFFVDSIPFDKKSVTIATTIIELAHSLGFKVVAEGVERKEQLDFLSGHGCDYYQGYYFSKPLPPESFFALFKETKNKIV